MSRSLSLSLVAVLAALSAGCSTDYIYRPVTPDAIVAGVAASHYPVPESAPEGDVAVATFGITDARPDGSSDAPTMHVRLILSNERGAVPWTFDTREIEMDLPGEGKSRPAMVNASVPGLPLVSVAPATQVAVDAFFPLPDDIGDEDDLPAFDVRWIVHTQSGSVAQRTSFGRVEESAPPPRTTIVYGGVIGWGTYWYWDPLWPTYRFVHVRRGFYAPGGHVTVVTRGGGRGRGGHVHTPAPAHRGR